MDLHIFYPPEYVPVSSEERVEQRVSVSMCVCVCDLREWWGVVCGRRS